MRAVLLLLIISQASLFSLSKEAGAWEVHRSLMPWVISRLSPEVTTALAQPVGVWPPETVRSRFETIATVLKLNPSGILLSGSENSGRKILYIAVDDPDQGMDQDLPAAFDPKNERKFMGGSVGPTSQGFRHMFFGGWNLQHPVNSFQVPFHPLGQAPERATLLAEYSRQLLRSGDFAWGMRTLGWALHYLQDLSQPFHTVQVPDLRMIPLTHILSGFFTNLIPETTRVISNFHWVYEGYVLERLQSPEPSTLKACLDEKFPASDLSDENLHLLPQDVATRSRKFAAEMGSALVAFTAAAGIDLKNTSYDLAHKIGHVDYQALGVRSDIQAERDRLERVTCLELRSGLDASVKLINWAFQP